MALQDLINQSPSLTRDGRASITGMIGLIANAFSPKARQERQQMAALRQAEMQAQTGEAGERFAGVQGRQGVREHLAEGGLSPELLQLQQVQQGLEQGGANLDATRQNTRMQAQNAAYSAADRSMRDLAASRYGFPSAAYGEYAQQYDQNKAGIAQVLQAIRLQGQQGEREQIQFDEMQPFRAPMAAEQLIGAKQQNQFRPISALGDLSQAAMYSQFGGPEGQAVRPFYEMFDMNKLGLSGVMQPQQKTPSMGQQLLQKYMESKGQQAAPKTPTAPKPTQTTTPKQAQTRPLSREAGHRETMQKMFNQTVGQEPLLRNNPYLYKHRLLGGVLGADNQFDPQRTLDVLNYIPTDADRALGKRSPLPMGPFDATTQARLNDIRAMIQQLLQGQQ